MVKHIGRDSNSGFLESVERMSSSPNGGLQSEKTPANANGEKKKEVFTVEVAKLPSDNEPQMHGGHFNPHDNRSVEHPTTNMETLFHLLKGSLGTGILAMPNAFYHAGWAIGIAGTVLIGIICTYCVHILVKSQYELCRKRRIGSLNYPETAEEAMKVGPSLFKKCAPYAGHIVNAFLLVYQLGTCCVYIVFVSSNVKDVVDYYASKLDVRIYMLILLIPFILINCVRNLKLLAPFSTVANAVTLIGFGITLYYVLAPSSMGDGEGLPSISDRPPVGDISNLPLFVGTVLFALEAIGVIMPLENNMKTPKSFGGPLGVLNRAMSCIVLLYVAMGFFGYLKYGPESAERKDHAGVRHFHHLRAPGLRRCGYHVVHLSCAEIGKERAQAVVGILRESLSCLDHILPSRGHPQPRTLHLTLRSPLSVCPRNRLPSNHPDRHLLERKGYASLGGGRTCGDLQPYLDPLQEEQNGHQEHPVSHLRPPRPRRWNLHLHPGYRRKVFIMVQNL
ncbi:hypothetical protein J437_LFUL013257 [Ladona fulva]|uniref:Amino acid transporter transmembrane domain-containing protein n=1 Tax=Ladona fulva TaxID=123851 RepID=A0A8K0P4G8_LADFU|nr:hypothetical protein J437_LFUL013257 [Ladona fulva]